MKVIVQLLSRCTNEQAYGWSAQRFTMVPDIVIDKNGQDMSSGNDGDYDIKIDWSKTVDQIDEQLYKKYGLTDDEKEYIKSKVDYYTKNRK